MSRVTKFEELVTAELERNADSISETEKVQLEKSLKALSPGNHYALRYACVENPIFVTRTKSKREPVTSQTAADAPTANALNGPLRCVNDVDNDQNQRDLSGASDHCDSHTHTHPHTQSHSETHMPEGCERPVLWREPVVMRPTWAESARRYDACLAEQPIMMLEAMTTDFLTALL